MSCFQGYNVEDNTHWSWAALSTGTAQQPRHLTWAISGSAMTFRKTRTSTPMATAMATSTTAFLLRAVRSFERKACFSFGYQVKFGGRARHRARWCGLFPWRQRFKPPAIIPETTVPAKPASALRFNAAAEYRRLRGSTWSGEIGLDNAQDYRRYAGNICYLFENLNQASCRTGQPVPFHLISTD